MHLIESTGRLERSRTALARAGWTLSARPAGADAPARGPSAACVIDGAVDGVPLPRGVDFVLRDRGGRPLAYVRAGARRDVTRLAHAARADGVPFAFALGRSRVRELVLAPFDHASGGPPRERERKAVPGPERLGRRARKRLGLPLTEPSDEPANGRTTDPDALLVALERAAAHVARVHGLGTSADALRVRQALGAPVELCERWPSPRTREPLLAALDAAGLDLAGLALRAERAGVAGACDADGLDVLLAVGWNEPARAAGGRCLSRRERVQDLVRRDGGRGPRVWRVADARERALLEHVLERYAARGLAEPWLPGRLDARALRELGGAAALSVFGTRRRARKALRRLARALHRIPDAERRA